MKLSIGIYDSTLEEAEEYMQNQFPNAEIELPYPKGQWRQWTQEGKVIAHFLNKKLQIFWGEMKHES